METNQETLNQNLNEDENKAIKVVMIGSSRSGKSSILASMFHEMQHNNVIPQYLSITSKETKAVILSTEEMVDMLEQDEQNNTKGKMGALFGTSEFATYHFTVKNKYAECGLEPVLIDFFDIPGEVFTDVGEEDYNLVMGKLETAQIILIAVDTPALMYAKRKGKAGINRVINCTDGVLNAIQSLGNQLGRDILRLVVFVPVKCEAWVKRKKMDDVYEQIKVVYEDHISQLQQFANMKSMIMPIETIGGLVFDSFTEEDKAKLLMYGEHNPVKVYEDKLTDAITDYKERKLVRCEQEFPNSKVVILKDGSPYTLQDDDKVYKTLDLFNVYPYAYEEGKMIPYMWYKKVGKYAPKNCDQLLIQLLMFTIQASCYEAKQPIKDTMETDFTKVDASSISLLFLPWGIIRIIIERFKAAFKKMNSFNNVKQFGSLVNAIKEMKQDNCIKEDYQVIVDNIDEDYKF